MNLEDDNREFEIRDELRTKRKVIKTFEELTDYLKDITDNYGNGYGEAPRSIAQASLAVAYFLANEFGITGFQASFVMWDFIQDWLYSNNKCGLKIVDYDDMLYPQYWDAFDKTISPWVWEALQTQAKKNLEDTSHTAQSVIDHWQSIVDGQVPFGYRVKER